jgi:hypothetical protein
MSEQILVEVEGGKRFPFYVSRIPNVGEQLDTGSMGVFVVEQVIHGTAGTKVLARPVGAGKSGPAKSRK